MALGVGSTCTKAAFTLVHGITATAWCLRKWCHGIQVGGTLDTHDDGVQLRGAQFYRLIRRSKEDLYGLVSPLAASRGELRGLLSFTFRYLFALILSPCYTQEVDLSPCQYFFTSVCCAFAVRPKSIRNIVINCSHGRQFSASRLLYTESQSFSANARHDDDTRQSMNDKWTPE